MQSINPDIYFPAHAASTPLAPTSRSLSIVPVYISVAESTGQQSLPRQYILFQKQSLFKFSGSSTHQDICVLRVFIFTRIDTPPGHNIYVTFPKKPPMAMENPPRSGH